MQNTSYASTQEYLWSLVDKETLHFVTAVENCNVFTGHVVVTDDLRIKLAYNICKDSKELGWGLDEAKLGVVCDELQLSFTHPVMILHDPVLNLVHFANYTHNEVVEKIAVSGITQELSMIDIKGEPRIQYLTEINLSLNEVDFLTHVNESLLKAQKRFEIKTWVNFFKNGDCAPNLEEIIKHRLLTQNIMARQLENSALKDLDGYRQDVNIIMEKLNKRTGVFIKAQYKAIDFTRGLDEIPSELKKIFKK